MGKQSNAIMDYLQDNERFADLFNGCFFQGQEVIRPGDLMEGSEVYREDYLQEKVKVPNEKEDNVIITVKDASVPRIRDVKKWLRSGGRLKVLAVENQNLIDFTMPWRNMNYDSLEYGRQIRTLKRRNKKGNKLRTEAERMCGLTREDRLAPVFTVCLYHGEEKWNGPRSLKDMMDFGEDDKLWETLFADYHMQLVCLNEMEDFSTFHSPLKELFTLMSYRRDKEGLKELLEKDPTYRELDEETAQVVGIMMGVTGLMDRKKEYYREGKCDVCEALQEWAEESRREGWDSGRKAGKDQINKLNQFLAEDKRIDDIVRSASDEAYQFKLLKEYNLVLDEPE